MNGRLASLDAFRGLDMLFIMGFSSLVTAVAWCFSSLEYVPFIRTNAIALQMHHVAWEGLRLYDMIFPTFIFIAGISFPFSYARQVARGDSRLEIHLRLVKRMVLLVVLGVVYNGLFKLNFPLRYGSVLGKIGIAWFVAALAYIHFGLKARIGLCAALLVGYCLAMHIFVAPDAPAGVDGFSRLGCLSGWLERVAMPGKLHGGDFDGSGWFVDVMAASSAMLGMFTGDLLRSSRFDGTRKTLLMLAGAAVLIALGLVATPVCPIIKKIWTPTFVLVCGGADLAVLAALYWIMDVKGWRAWAFPLRVIGLNAITVYLLQKVVDIGSVVRFFVGTSATIQQHFIGSKDLTGFGLCGLCTSQALSLAIYWFVYVLVCWLVLCFLHQKKVFLKV